MIRFENQEARLAPVTAFLRTVGINTLEEAERLCLDHGMDVRRMVHDIQSISFDDAGWAYTVGAAAVLKKKIGDASQAALLLGKALQSFCLDGSVADQRQIGLGHGRLASMILDDSVRCFAFLAGHESFAAAEGALGIACSANRARKTPLRVILNGLGKDAAAIIARVNGFTYVRTSFDFETEQLTILDETPFSKGERAAVRCYGADEMREGVAIMEYEEVDISISGNATNMIRFQHPVAGTYKKRCLDRGKKYFACASGGGIGRTLNPDDTSAGPSSYGQTDLMARMYADATFAGSSSVPAHVEMMGFIGMGNNPVVGASVSIAVAAVDAVRRETA
ncbi:GGGtGRT protein [uncultured Mailhella sp.]|uniref:GGGtGRT protein n=1 Tax=uncultured Mailhella sp. TaxID=1981031 RepID=UPI002629681F|nr:GGGtGRT protein [uncultured Mailhella sp.]